MNREEITASLRAVGEVKPIKSARENQLRCAGELLNPDQPDKRGAALGLFDWFCEEFLLTFPEAVR